MQRNEKGQFKKTTTESIVKKIKNLIFLNKNYSYKFVKYLSYSSPIKIKCNKHGIFQITPNGLFSKKKNPKRGCGKCFIEQKEKDFIKLANKIHENKYNYSKVKYIKSKAPVIILCKDKSHKLFYFKATPDNHIGKKSGCPKCGHRKAGLFHKKTNNEIIKLIKRIHKKRILLNKFIYNGIKNKAIFICPTHGEFKVTPDSVINNKSGCAKCSIIRTGLNRRKDTKDFIKRSKKIHGNKYNYSKSKYVVGKTPIIISCKIHGDFFQEPFIHLNGSGCNLCGNDLIGNKLRSSIENVIDRLESMRGKGRFDYSLIYKTYKNNLSKLKIKCIKHNKFFYASASDQEMSGGCINCKFKSIKEELIASILYEKKIRFFHNWKSHSCTLTKDKAKFDFFIPRFNLIIEHDGEQHFKATQFGDMTIQQARKEFKLTKKHDFIKNAWCKKNNINLLRIKYFEKNLKNIISNKIKEINKNSLF
jgi:hypothetical protein